MNALPDVYRRRLLKAGAGAGALALALSGCHRRLQQRIDASFLQLTQADLELDETAWRLRLALHRALGCTELILQWTAQTGGDASWALPDALMHRLLDMAHDMGMTLKSGGPYDTRWWQMLAQPDAQLRDFLDYVAGVAQRHMQAASWQEHPAFHGWYVPYEIDQYHWAVEARQQILIDWLRIMADAATHHGRGKPAISTFYSRLETPGRLDLLWQAILGSVALRPMVQDGVGVAGMANLGALQPLFGVLRKSGVEFDLIIELFHELPESSADGSSFHARSARPERVGRQLAAARKTGASRLTAFALDPWVVGDKDGAAHLLANWDALPLPN